MTAPSSPARSSWLPLLAVCLGTFMLLLDVTIVNVALPDMAVDLGASFAGLQWVVDVYALALAALLLLVGSLSDIVGRRRSYVAGLAVFVAASFVCGIAPSEAVLIAARGVQGIGAAGMFATTIALLNATYEGRARGTAFAAWGATSGAAAAAGPIVGGLLTQGLSWRWIFLVNVPVGIATILLARRTLQESRLAGLRRPDWLGGAAFTLGAAALTFALIRANDEGWTSAATLGVLALAVVSFGLFVLVERRVAEPLFDLRLLRQPTFTGMVVAAFALSVAAFGGLVYISIWLQTVIGLEPISAGLVTLPLSGLAFVVAASSGGVLHRLSPRWVVGGGLVVIGAGDLAMTGLDAGSGWAALLPGMALIGLGVGAINPLLVSTAMTAVPQERGGMAAGAVNTARQLGLALGIAVLGSVFSSSIADRLAGPDDLAHAVSSGGSAGVLAQAPPASRGALDAAIHAAGAHGLGSALLVAGLVGVLGGALVALLARPVRAAEPAPAATPRHAEA
ncbi:MFS transporter [Patulibacter sp. SYSU D01012]|uniref:MFS transporter n=1 Tax=Patulibacter sp. SYSU D01012 TaxID=2817381 RepID=UPI001B30DD4B|nr:MFS transporter [Patulibacter sp. SYSU D01012]